MSILMLKALLIPPSSELNTFAHVDRVSNHFSGNYNMSCKMGPEPFIKLEFAVSPTAIGEGLMLMSVFASGR